MRCWKDDAKDINMRALESTEIRDISSGTELEGMGTLVGATVLEKAVSAFTGAQVSVELERISPSGSFIPC